MPATLGTGPCDVAAPDQKVLAGRAACHIAQLEPIAARMPSVGHLHPPAAREKLGDGVRQLLRLDRDELGPGQPCRSWLRGGHGTPGDSVCATEAT